MKKILINVLLLFLIVILAGCENKENNTNNTPIAERISTNTSISNSENSMQNDVINVVIPATNETQNNTTVEKTEEPNQTAKPQENDEPKETEIASFTTKLLTDDENRETNIDITCSKINNQVVEPGETFSFTKTVGQSTPEKGYEKADIFDANGNKVKGLGGGNCQVSSTLYNAVLEADLEVVERHPHSEKVYYVPEGKDATVSYGSLDFRFKNNKDYSIKIYANSTETHVNVRLVKID